jgi:hypothetical protein
MEGCGVVELRRLIPVAWRLDFGGGVGQRGEGGHGFIAEGSAEGGGGVGEWVRWLTCGRTWARAGGWGRGSTGGARCQGSERGEEGARAWFPGWADRLAGLAQLGRFPFLFISFLFLFSFI